MVKLKQFIPFLLAGLVLLAGIVSGCVSSSGAIASPALLVDPSESDIQSIEAGIIRLTGIENVDLSSDVFTKTHKLRLERNVPKGIGLPDTGGRLVEPPVQIHLLKEKKMCFLLHVNSGKKVRISGVKCKLENNSD